MLIDGQARVIAMALYARHRYMQQFAIDNLDRGCFVGTTGTNRSHPNNLRNKHKAFMKRVARRRAKKGYR